MYVCAPFAVSLVKTDPKVRRDRAFHEPDAVRFEEWADSFRALVYIGPIRHDHATFSNLKGFGPYMLIDLVAEARHLLRRLMQVACICSYLSHSSRCCAALLRRILLNQPTNQPNLSCFPRVNSFQLCVNFHPDLHELASNYLHRQQCSSLAVSL
jgi:hypothetical protein